MTINKDLALISCTYCRWAVPNDLVEKLIQEKIIYCEKCGFPLNPNNYNLEILKKRLLKKESSQKNNTSKKIKKTTQKVYNKVRAKLKDLKEKYKID
ncbi:MAG: hypothetical protein ACTSR8_03785 [Promethearchaeota archaeon]